MRGRTQRARARPGVRCRRAAPPAPRALRWTLVLPDDQGSKDRASRTGAGQKQGPAKRGPRQGSVFQQHVCADATAAAADAAATTPGRPFSQVRARPCAPGSFARAGLSPCRGRCTAAPQMTSPHAIRTERRFAAEPGTAAQAVRQQGAGVEGRGIFERIQTIADGQTMPHTVPTGVPVQPRSPPAVPVSSVQKLHPASGLQVQLGQPLPAGTVAPVSSGPLSTARQMTGAQGVTAEIVFADSHGGKAAGRQGDAITLSSRDLQHPTVSNLAPDDSAQPAVLQGYNADLVQPQLRYGDSISLLPDGRNSIVAFGGDYEGRAWAEMLDKEVGVPPNVRDCEWWVRKCAVGLCCVWLHVSIPCVHMPAVLSGPTAVFSLSVIRCLEPKRQYVEARKLAKLIKTSDWDDGKNLPLPRTPQHGENLEEYANEVRVMLSPLPL